MLKAAHAAIAAAILYCLALMLGAFPARAQSICVDHYSGLRLIRESGFRPPVVAYMAAGNGEERKVEIWAGKRPGTWTLFYWANDLMICPMFVGDRWTDQRDEPGMVSRPK